MTNDSEMERPDSVFPLFYNVDLIVGMMLRPEANGR